MNFSEGEKLTRFIFSRRHFSTENKIVKYAAFMPPPDSEDLSVFRISALSESEVWGIGRENVQGERTLRARADLSAEVMRIILKSFQILMLMHYMRISHRSRQIRTCAIVSQES